MTGPTLDELRDLSLRSRRAQRWGSAALVLALLLYPAQFVLHHWLSPNASATIALVLGAGPFLRYAYLAGEERGAFRRVFRRIADEKRTRTLVPVDAQASAPVEAQAPTRR